MNEFVNIILLTLLVFLIPLLIASIFVRKANYKEGIKQKPFPECCKRCKVIEELGVGECENVCPEKFRKGKYRRIK